MSNVNKRKNENSEIESGKKKIIAFTPASNFIAMFNSMYFYDIEKNILSCVLLI